MGDSSPPREAAQKLVEGKNAFKGSAIRGSSLLNTVGDIRPFIQRGSCLLVNGVSYELSVTGDWNANSVQLTTDYAGETNFDVTITIPAGSFSPKRKKGSAPKDSASSHASLAQSMDQLNSITEAFNVKLRLQDETAGTTNTNPTCAPTKANSKPHIPKAPSKPKAAVVSIGENQSNEEQQRNMAPSGRPTPLKRVTKENTIVMEEYTKEDGDVDTADPEQEAHVAKPKASKTPKSSASKPVATITSAPQGRTVVNYELRNAPDRPIKQATPIGTRDKPGESTTGVRGESTAAAQETAEVSSTTEKSVDEQRKAAALRVQRKLKEEQARIEKLEAAKAQEQKLQHEASVAKAKELQARTALRVGKYKEENQRREEQQKQAELYEQQQREQRNQEFLGSSRHMKMRDFRRDARNRLEQIAQADYRKAVEEEENVQKRLFEIHKKYDANTTFLPRLDAPSQVSGAGSRAGVGVIDDKKMKPNVVVKSIAVELEQFERESGNFPEEPVLRSRSARLATRNKVASSGAACAAGSSQMPAVSAPQRQNSLPAVVPVSTSKKIAFSTAGAPAKPAADDDDWSDDEPDALLRGKESYLAAQRSSNVDGDGEYTDDGDADYGGGNTFDEDSLVIDRDDGNEPDFERDFDDAMEKEIFGHLKGHQRAAPVAYVAQAGNQQQPKATVKGLAPLAYQTPLAAGRKAAPVSRDPDGYVSDGSDITIDSMLGGGKSATGHKHSAKKVTTKPGQIKVVTGHPTPQLQAAQPSQVQFQAPQQRRAPQGVNVFKTENLQQQTASAYAPLAVRLAQPQNSTVQFGGPPPVLPYDVQQAKSQPGNLAPSGGGSSNPSVSPTKPKVKNVFKKLKPIPISSPYRPIANPI